MNVPDNVNRRSFLKASSSIALGLSALNHRALAGVGPNDTIRVGCIGLGGMGTGRLKQFIRESDCQVVAVCDVDSQHLNQAVSAVEEATNRKPDAYKDFRELLDRNDIDAVTVTTPDHWHALPFVYACETGKDVFVEKPFAHSLYEGQKMVEAAEHYKRVSQMGNHIHAGENYRQVVQVVRSGILGEITRVQIWQSAGLGTLEKTPDCSPPDHLDYEFWLGPAPKRPYNPNRCHFNFRYFWDYAGGAFTDFWCHITDVPYWALELKRPRKISAVGSRRLVTNDMADTPNTMELIYDYDGVPLVYSLSPNGIPGFMHMGGLGCMIQGTKGTVVTNYDRHEVYLDNKKVDNYDLGSTPALASSPGHIRQFLDSVKTRVQPDCNHIYANNLAMGMHMGVIAYRTGEELVWNDNKQRFDGNSKANRLMKFRYRRPWKI